MNYCIMKFTKKEAKEIGDFIHINFDVVPLTAWTTGLNVELEHKDITSGDIYTTARIALAHITEYPNYYQYLKKMEKKLKKFWKDKTIPDVLVQ